MRNKIGLIRYKLSQPLQAVKLAEHAGSTLRDPTTTLVDIPAGAIVEVEGRVSRSGLVNVEWDGQFFSIYHQDLQEKAGVVNTQLNTAG